MHPEKGTNIYENISMYIWHLLGKKIKGDISSNFKLPSQNTWTWEEGLIFLILRKKKLHAPFQKILFKYFRLHLVLGSSVFLGLEKICMNQITVAVWTQKNFFPLLTRPQGSQGCQKITFFFLQMKLFSFCAKIALKRHKLQKPSKLKKKCQKNPVFLDFLEYSSIWG